MAEEATKRGRPGEFSVYRDLMRFNREGLARGDTHWTVAKAAESAKIIERNYDKRIQERNREKQEKEDGNKHVLNEPTQQKKDFQAAQEAYRNSPEGKAQAAVQAARVAEREARPIKLWGKGSVEEQEEWKRAQGPTKDELPTAHALRHMQGLLAEL